MKEALNRNQPVMLKTAIVLNPVYVTLFWSVVILLSQKPGSKPGRSLFIFMLTATILYLSHALYFSGNLLQYSYIDGLYLFCSLSVYPLFYFYVRQLATKSGVQPVQLLHLVIPLVFAVTQYILYSGLTQADRVTYLLTNIDHHPSPGGRFYGLYLNSLLGRYVFATQVAVYIILSIRLIKNHQEQVEQMFSNEDRYGLGWVKWLTLFMIIMSVTVIHPGYCRP